MLDLFSALRGMFRPIVEGSPIDLIFEEPEGIPRLYTDDKKLAQILRNFISNAVKFTPQGGARVGTDGKPAAGPLRRQRHRYRHCPRAARPAFRRFRPVDSPLQKRLRGTGLGLALCKRFAELLGGRVGVESEPCKGSEFYVVLPLAIDTEPSDGA